MGRKPGFLRRNRPSFFKVLVDDFVTMLRIPPAFVKHFDGVVPHKCKLGSPAVRRFWHVKVKKEGNRFAFRKGWRVFVRDNCLELGDFLVFKYAGNSRFYVRIYGRNACEKEFAIKGRKGDEPNSCQENDQEEKEIRENQERSTGPEAAENFISKNPFFKVVMQQTYVRGRSMIVPKGFIDRHIKKVRETVMLQVEDRLWPVNLLTYSYCAGRFYGGWPAFAKDNALKIGDVCFFELIKSRDVLMKVSIVRGGR